MFALQLSNDGTALSTLWLGGYSTSVARSMLTSQYNATFVQNTSDANLGSLIAWTPSVNSNYWSGNLNSVTVNGVSIPVSVNFGIFDSGASLMYLPTKDYNALMTQVTSGKTCTITAAGSTLCPCTSITDSSFPPITIVTGQATLSLT